MLIHPPERKRIRINVFLNQCNVQYVYYSPFLVGIFLFYSFFRIWITTKSAQSSLFANNRARGAKINGKELRNRPTGRISEIWDVRSNDVMGGKCIFRFRMSGNLSYRSIENRFLSGFKINIEFFGSWYAIITQLTINFSFIYIFMLIAVRKSLMNVVETMILTEPWKSSYDVLISQIPIIYRRI